MLGSADWSTCHLSEKELNGFAETLLEIYQTHQKNDRQVGFVVEAFYLAPSKVVNSFPSWRVERGAWHVVPVSSCYWLLFLARHSATLFPGSPFFPSRGAGMF